MIMYSWILHDNSEVMLHFSLSGYNYTLHSVLTCKINGGFFCKDLLLRIKKYNVAQ